MILDAESSEAPPFRWLGVTPHPSGDAVLAVEGRYDACSCQLKIVDLREITRPQCLQLFDVTYSGFDGWTSESTLQITRNVEICISSGNKLDDMTAEELKKFEQDNNDSHYVDEKMEIDVSDLLLAKQPSPHSKLLILDL